MSSILKMNAYVVSSIAALSRREHISRQLSALNIQWRFVDAVFPGQADLQAYQSIHSRVLGRELVRGEIGCRESHISVLSLIANSDFDGGLVLEDDALLSFELPEVLMSVYGEISFDVLLLGYSKVHPRRVARRRWIEPLIPIATAWGYDICRAVRQRRSGTVGYFITRLGARKMLDGMEREFSVADDWPMLEMSGLNILHVYPPLVRENIYSHASSIAPERSSIEKVWNERLLELLYYLKVIRGFIWFMMFNFRTRVQRLFGGERSKSNSQPGGMG